jgi:isochorismate synthase EntC
MTGEEIFSAASRLLQQLRGRDQAAYLLYCTEQQRAWVAAAQPKLILAGGTVPQFLSELAAGTPGIFLASPTFTQGAKPWPVAVLLTPSIEIEIDSQGARCTAENIDSNLNAMLFDDLAKSNTEPATSRNSVRWHAWRGEGDAEFTMRLQQAIAATQDRVGKVIVSRRYERATGNADPLRLLRLFGAAEPDAAAIHYVELPGRLISMGTSPENIVEVHDGQVSIDAVAGTRPRTGEADVDAALRTELLQSVKEAHEHGLAVGRALAFARSVCTEASASLSFERRVRVLRAVQHLHSRAGGILAPGLDFATLVGRCHPPLMSYPEQLAGLFPPPWPGHFYGGMVGRVSGTNGSAFLNLRCLEIEAERVNVYAGVGIVNGSSLQDELAEVRNKLGTVTDVIEQWLTPS